MKKSIYLLLIGFSNLIYSQDSLQFTDLYGDYLGQTPPGDTPVVFARGIVSTDDIQHSPAIFSPDGNEVFWWTDRPPGPDHEEWLHWCMTMQRIGNRWTRPMIFLPYIGESFFSTDGQRLYFGGKDDNYYIEKEGNSWSEPKGINLLTQYPEVQIAPNPSIAGNGTLYFFGIAEGLGLENNYAIYRSKLINGEYAQPELLPRCINLPPFQSWTPFIIPDESYLIFSSNRTGGYGSFDLYITFKIGDIWTEPINMGDKINSGYQERCPGVTPEGKYLFFTRWTPDHDHDVFWVTTGIIDDLRKAVLSDRNSNQIEGQEIQVFPSPANKNLRIKYTEILQREVHYEIIDLTGKTSKQGELESDIIDVSGLSNCIYILNLSSTEGSISKKIVIK